MAPYKQPDGRWKKGIKIEQERLDMQSALALQIGHAFRLLKVRGVMNNQIKTALRKSIEKKASNDKRKIAQMEREIKGGGQQNHETEEEV